MKTIPNQVRFYVGDEMYIVRTAEGQQRAVTMLGHEPINPSPERQVIAEDGGAPGQVILRNEVDAFQVEMLTASQAQSFIDEVNGDAAVWADYDWRWASDHC
jgi:hypothetical protein